MFQQTYTTKKHQFLSAVRHNPGQLVTFNTAIYKKKTVYFPGRPAQGLKSKPFSLIC